MQQVREYGPSVFAVRSPHPASSRTHLQTELYHHAANPLMIDDYFAFELRRHAPVAIPSVFLSQCLQAFLEPGLFPSFARPVSLTVVVRAAGKPNEPTGL